MEDQYRKLAASIPSWANWHRLATQLLHERQQENLVGPMQFPLQDIDESGAGQPASLPRPVRIKAIKAKPGCGSIIMS
jgi:hypothetical protein